MIRFWALVIAAPLAVLAVLRLRPSLDVSWEHHPAHFWLVLAAAAIATVLGYSIFAAARRRRDARLALVSLAFVTSAGFLGLHALATPGVLVGKNAGFELATPAGLLLGSVFVAASALEPGPAAASRIVRASGPLLAGLAALIAAWAAVSLAELPPLDSPLAAEQLDGWQLGLGGAGVALYALGAAGYARLYRRRGERFLLLVAAGFLLLADALLVVAWAQNWRVTWWEWHVLMLGSFALIALAAHREWHEERFSALYLEQTLAGVRDASVMFADLMGFTPYSERTPPAEVAAMLNTYFERLVPLVEEQGGDVHELIGDAVMAVFNKEGDQPEHALLAARAALAFQREAGAIADAHPEWPRFRVGVNSGEVLAGVVGAGSGRRKHGLVGDTVNLAARLEHEAKAGQVVVGAGTYERLPPGALVERLPPLQVKGKADPVEAYVLHGLREEER
ncbi:MAG: adenylate/guanylate cyclase domain-containing protein [Gaiellaceae bacterium]